LRRLLELWQVELIQKQDKFNLSWFLPAVWRATGCSISIFTLQIFAYNADNHSGDHRQSAGTGKPFHLGRDGDLLGIACFEAILGILRIFIFTASSDLGLSAQVFRHLIQLPLAYFEARSVETRLHECRSWKISVQFLTGTALTVILDSFVVMYLALMFYYSVSLTWVPCCCSAICCFGVNLILRSWLNQTFNQSADSQSF